MKIGEYCQAKPFTVEPDTAIRTAAAEMRNRHIGCLIVVEDGKPVGLLTDRDLALKPLRDLSDPGAPVSRYMSTAMVTATTDQSISEVTKLMRDHAFRRIPVVAADGSLAGLVTADDLFVLLAREIGSLADSLEEELQNETVTAG